LEGREQPATFTWVGGYTPTSYGFDAYDTKNWATDLPYPYPAPWNLFHRPGPNDDVFFMPGSNLSCDMTTKTLWEFKSLNLASKFEGTLTTRFLLVQDLIFESGTINPYGPELADVMVMDQFVWTGGVLNGTGYHNTLSVVGGAGDIIPPAGGLLTGNSLSFEPDGTGPDGGSKGTFNAGTVTFGNGAGIFVLEYCNVQMKPQQDAFLVTVGTVNTVTTSRSGIYVGTRGSVQVVAPAGLPANTWAKLEGDNFTLRVEGGDYKEDAGIEAKFTGHVGPGDTGPSVKMTAGRIALQHGRLGHSTESQIVATHGVELTGGKLSTLANGVSDRGVVIDGNLVNSGADIWFCEGATTFPSGFGGLHVNGNVTWTGGTFRPVVSAAQGGLGKSTRWTSTMTFTVGGTAKIAPGGVSASGTLNVRPPAGMTWPIIQADVAIVNNAYVPPVEGGWAQLIIVAGNPCKEWKLESI
jgi:hypothetical protein